MIDLKKIKTYSVKNRHSKENLDKFPDLSDKPKSFKDLNLTLLAQAIVEAKKKDKKVIFQYGGHLIKTGMSIYIIDLINRGLIDQIATNGAGSIHDFEIAYLGKTSEDVAKALEDGSFGMARETGELMNEAINSSTNGYGYAIGELISKNNYPFKSKSILCAAYEKKIPASVFVAIGTDIIHQHPSCNGAKIGQASYTDFLKYTQTVSLLKDGVLVNIGSAVILPEVFLKALSISRNLQNEVTNITTANLDMIDHYRPRVNIIERPTSLGKIGYLIKGRHEETVPALYHEIIRYIN